MRSPALLLSSSLATLSSTFCSLLVILAGCLLLSTGMYAQSDTTTSSIDMNNVDNPRNLEEYLRAHPSDSNYYNLSPQQKKNRTWIATGVNVVGYGGLMGFFAAAWYDDYKKTKLHSFDDSKEWLQMDKLGHVYGTWTQSRVNNEIWKWTGMKREKRIWISGLTSFTFQTVIEYLDGRSADWGWSWADFGSNILGSGSFIAQELAWDEQKIKLKWSFHRKSYNDQSLNHRSDVLYGNSLPERALKDYNGQTYWASVGIQSLLPRSKLPSWLSVAMGHGAEGMFGGTENIAKDMNGNIIFDRRDIRRYRQWFLSPDIDWTKIKTDKKVLKLLFVALNAFKFPAPALEYSKGKWRAHAIYF